MRAALLQRANGVGFLIMPRRTRRKIFFCKANVRAFWKRQKKGDVFDKTNVGLVKKNRKIGTCLQKDKAME